ncbi:hypothetical protein LguiB_021062 [Lonicera macranthoides]
MLAATMEVFLVKLKQAVSMKLLPLDIIESNTQKMKMSHFLWKGNAINQTRKALPYLYVPCSDLLHQPDLEGLCTNVLSLAIEKALKSNAGSKRQHVHDYNLVRAKKFYGYHSSEELLFAKIYLTYNEAAYEEALRLLKWLAASQAAEDKNSDDEHARQTI